MLLILMTTITVSRNCSGACFNLEKAVWMTGRKDWAKVQSNKNKNSAAHSGRLVLLESYTALARKSQREGFFSLLSTSAF